MGGYGNKLIRDTQHGFRKGKSCLTNILSFLDKVLCSLDEGNCMDVIFLDFAKAFDKVPHKRLLEKIEKHGIGGKLLRMIKNWLCNRKQRVCILGKFSQWQNVLSGVPQGSVLGPLLFLIYINDLESGIVNNVLKFADDTKMFGNIVDEWDRSLLQKDLDELVNWSHKWQMEFNTAKCKVMHVGKKNRNFSYHMVGQALVEVQHEKDLGVMISADMKSSDHCIYAFNKANRVLGMIRRTISNKDERIMVSLYKSLVRPHLEYCVSAWSPHYNKDKDLLERIQHRFTRMVIGLRNLTYLERLKKLKLWTLEERRNRGDLIEVYKMCKGFTHVKMEELFVLDDNIKGTRGHRYKLLKGRCVSDVRKYFFSNRVIDRWNRLDQATVDAPSVNRFKSGLDKMRKYKDGFFMDCR